jgi:hypothetical protein
MRVTDYIGKMVVISMIFFISLFSTENLNAQMTFHLSGQYVYGNNLIKDLNPKEQREKITTAKLKDQREESRLKRSNKNKASKIGAEKGNTENKWSRSEAGDSVQKLHLAQLNRNFTENSQ